MGDRRVELRAAPDLVSSVEAAAEREGVTAAEWMREAWRQRLERERPQAPKVRRGRVILPGDADADEPTQA